MGRPRHRYGLIRRSFADAEPPRPRRRLQDSQSAGVPLNAPYVANTRTGMGGAADHNVETVFVPRVLSRYAATILHNYSWAARKLIDIPVEDMWVRGRKWTGDDEKAIKAIADAERNLRAHARLERVMKAGRLYGTAVMIIASKRRPLHTPLDPDNVEQDEVANLIVTDRYALEVEATGVDPTIAGYGEPSLYRYTPRLTYAGAQGKQTPIHEPQFVDGSRVIRFDGIAPLLDEGWIYGSGAGESASTGGLEWGISELTPAVEHILREAATAAGIGHIVQEGSIFVVKTQGLRAAATGREQDAETPDLASLGMTINQLKSIFRTLFIDKSDDAERINATWTGLADIFNAFGGRLAAIGDIPETRFLGKSPTGMDATGDSDMENYAIRIAALQVRLLTRPLYILDRVLAGHAGLPAPPPYEWIPLVDISPKSQAETSKIRTEAVLKALEDGAIVEDEARERLSTDEMWGELGPYPGIPPSQQEPEPGEGGDEGDE